MSPSFVTLDAGRIEYWALAAPADAPTLVFLHEGLGSLSMWRDFPARLAAATGCGALVFSRFGHGHSDLERAPRGPDFFKREAHETVPALLRALGLRDIVLVGHSDGGSIALCYLAAGGAARGAVVAAPHTFDEAVTWRAIAAQHAAWGGGALRGRLQRHHRDADATFHAWAGHWLDAGFRGWTIVPELAAIDRPVLAIQGEDDIYGSMAQIDAIAAHAGATVELRKLAQCGHDPFRDRPDDMLRLCTAFIAGLAGT